MLDIDFTFLFTLINLGILYFFVKKFLFSRLGEFMNKRSADIKASIIQGQELKAEGENYKNQYKEILDQANEERREILESARKKAAREYDEVMARAKTESNRILQGAQKEAQQEYQRLLEGARTEIAALAISAASKVIEQNMDSDKNHELVQHFLDKEASV